MSLPSEVTTEYDVGDFHARSTEGELNGDLKALAGNVMHADSESSPDSFRKEELSERVCSRLREHTEEIRRRELEEALDRLHACEGDVTEVEREIASQLSHRIVDRLFATPAVALQEASRLEDQEMLQEGLRIFQLDDPTNESLEHTKNENGDSDCKSMSASSE